MNSPTYKLPPLILLLFLASFLLSLLLVHPVALVYAAGTTLEGVLGNDDDLIRNRLLLLQQQTSNDVPGANKNKLSTDGEGNHKSLAREFLHAHNSIRSFYGEPPYVWNRTLARYARRWANTRRSDCSGTHSRGPYGENMFWGTGLDWRASDAVRSWAMEHYYYNPHNNTCMPGKMCGHYTQIIWNTTVMVGCARVECLTGGVVISCNYDPPGNFVGESPFQSID